MRRIGGGLRDTDWSAFKNDHAPQQPQRLKLARLAQGQHELSSHKVCIGLEAAKIVWQRASWSTAWYKQTLLATG